MKLLQVLRASYQTGIGFVMLAGAQSSFGAAPEERTETSAGSASTAIELDHDYSRVQVLDRGRTFVLSSLDGRIETFHCVGGKVLRVIDARAAPGIARYEIIDTDTVLATSSARQLVEAQTQLDRWLEQTDVVAKGGAAGCGLEASAASAALANAASCTSGPSCAAAWTVYALALEALERCTASEPLPF